MALFVPTGITNINGLEFSRTSLRVNWGGFQMGSAFKSVSVGKKLTPGISTGNAALPVARTRGKAEITADIEIFLSQWQRLQVFLNGIGAPQEMSYMEVSVPVVTILAWEPSIGSHLLEINGARVMEDSGAFTDNDDQLLKKITISAMNVIENGIPMVFQAAG